MDRNYALFLLGVLLYCNGGVVGQNSGDLRLVGGNATQNSTAAAGRLEIFLNGEWGTVSEAEEKLRAAAGDVACHQLGFLRAMRTGLAREMGFGEGEGKVWLEKVECLDSHRQSHLLRCTHQHSQPSPEYNHSMDLALQCSTTPVWDRPYEGSVRIANLQEGEFSSSGTLEVFLKGEWGTACATGVSKGDADSVCRQLGYTESLSFGVTSNPGAGPVWLEQYHCTEESSKCFSKCYKTPSTSSGHGLNQTFNHTQDVTINCTFIREHADKYSSGVNLNGFCSTSLVGNGGSLGIYIPLGVCLGIACCCCCCVFFLCVYCCRKRRKRSDNYASI